MVDEAKEPEGKKCSLLLLFTKVRPAKALLCQELLCTLEPNCNSTYVEVLQSDFNHYILSFCYFSTLLRPFFFKSSVSAVRSTTSVNRT